jgi:hypothetical protein
MLSFSAPPKPLSSPMFPPSGSPPSSSLSKTSVQPSVHSSRSSYEPGQEA